VVARLDRLRAQLTLAIAVPAADHRGRHRVSSGILPRRYIPPWRGSVGRSCVAALLVMACNGAEARRAADSAAHVTDSITIARADSIARARQDSIDRAQPGYIVDSILPIEEELRRFRADLKDVPTRLTGGAPTRDELVARFVRAIETSDTAALRGMAMTRAEFAYLYYPSSPYAKPPYRQPPWLTWMMLERASSAGLTRLLRRLGGQRLRYVDYACPAPAERRAVNVLWSKCVLRLTGPDGDTVRGQLFGAIIDRAGRWKFMSYANDF
jgi:hypothetical protein